MVAVTDDAVKISQFGKLLITATYVIATIIGLTYDLLDWLRGIFDLSSSKRKVRFFFNSSPVLKIIYRGKPSIYRIWHL
jgi:hypothetical protein